MKTQSPNSISIFRGRRSSPPLSWQAPSDCMEVLLRVLLVLCIILSLVLCGLRISGASAPLPTPFGQVTAQVASASPTASPQAQGS